MKEALSSSETSVLQEPHGVTSQKTPFFYAAMPFYIFCEAVIQPEKMMLWRFLDSGGEVTPEWRRWYHEEIDSLHSSRGVTERSRSRRIRRDSSYNKDK
jgi:hypothetical protein